MECESRFWEKVARGEPDECWEWQASTFPNGYGQFWLNGSPVLAHRVAAGRPEGQVNHKCDNRLCVNPAHLYEGDQEQNVADAHDRGGWSGPVKPSSKMTIDQVEKIRERYADSDVTYAELANDYGVSDSTIMRIIKGQTYSD